MKVRSCRGSGNLIALPLQKLPRADGNSVLVDEEFRPYGDQWAFLASVKRMPISAAEAVVMEAPAKWRSCRSENQLCGR
ncbi:MAG: TOTE conflict system archaeo-eukaryotic primase domain-containing protein [Terriglobales bacterium]